MEKKILLGFLLTLMIIVFIPVYAIGEPARQERALQRQQEETMERGAETFVALCANCHGPQGQGLIGPAVKGTKLNKEAMVKVINRGRPTERVPMPAWGAEDGGPLKSHQVSDLVLFIMNWDEAIMEMATNKHEAMASLPEEPVALGKQIFTTVGCSFCHGGGGEGTNFAPQLAGQTKERILKQVRQPRTPLMPAYTAQHLNDANLEKVVTFLVTLKAPSLPLAPAGASPDEAQVIGQGGRLFVSQGCSACHGAEGKGSAFAPSVIGKSRDEIVKQVRTPRGTMPPSPTSVLSDADLDKVVAFIQSLKGVSAPAPATPTLLPPAPAPLPPPLPTPTPAATAAPAPLPTVDTQAIAQGAQIFSSRGCSACHGPEGKGTGFAPSIVGKSRDEIVKQVRTPKGAMPPSTVSALSDADLDKVVAFINSLKPVSAPAPATPTQLPPTPAPLPSPVPIPAPMATVVPAPSPTPDSQAIMQGGQIFSSRGCGACHGPEGKGTGFAPSVIGKSRDEIIKQVRTPRGAMPPSSTSVLSDADLDKVVAFIDSLKK